MSLKDEQFRVSKDEGLDISLSNKKNIQQALDSSKHGGKKSNRVHIISIKELHYGHINTVKTIAINKQSSVLREKYVWYSMCTVYFRDICDRLDHKDGMIQLYIKKQKLGLYSIGYEDLKIYVDTLGGKSRILCSELDTEEFKVMLVAYCPPDIMSMIVRKTKLDAIVQDWTVKTNKDIVYTIFKGDKYHAIKDICDVVLSTDPNIVVCNLGKLNAMHIYRQYVSGDNVDLHLSMLFCCYEDDVNDYSTMASTDLLKKLTIRDQIDTLRNVAAEDKIDNLSSKESKLILGLNIL